MGMRINAELPLPADLKAEYQFRYDVISEYAPKLLSAEEVKAVIEKNLRKRWQQRIKARS